MCVLVCVCVSRSLSLALSPSLSFAVRASSTHEMGLLAPPCATLNSTGGAGNRSTARLQATRGDERNTLQSCTTTVTAIYLTVARLFSPQNSLCISPMQRSKSGTLSATRHQLNDLDQPSHLQAKTPAPRGKAAAPNLGNKQKKEGPT